MKYNYRPMIDSLDAAFGPGVFEVWDTGGGCTAIVAEMEGDITVMITDGEASPNGHDAFITDMNTREEEGGDNTFGYFVGVYTDEGATPLHQVDAPTAVAADLADIVTAALTAAQEENSK